MISANELRKKTKEVYTDQLNKELKEIEEKCISLATDEKNKGLVYSAYFDNISNGAIKVLRENGYYVYVYVYVKGESGKPKYYVSWND